MYHQVCKLFKELSKVEKCFFSTVGSFTSFFFFLSIGARNSFQRKDKIDKALSVNLRHSTNANWSQHRSSKLIATCILWVGHSPIPFIISLQNPNQSYASDWEGNVFSRCSKFYPVWATCYTNLHDVSFLSIRTVDAL